MSFEIECPFCDGTGMIGEDECQDCYGDGVISPIHQYIAVVAKYNSEVQLKTLLGKNFTDNLVATYQISEATDATEWAALSAGNKTAYAMILSMGIVDLTDGTSIRTTLWAMFDAESTTRAALITLLGE